MPRVPLRRDGQDDRRREGDPVCGSPSLHRCLRMRAGIFSHKDLPQGRRGARPEGKREGGRKGGGGRTGTAPHAFAKNLVKTECANISFDSGKTRRARITHAFPTTTARIGFARSRSFLSHDMFRTRDQNPEKSEADSYGDANMLPLSTDEPIAEGGASPHSSRAAHIERKKGNTYGNTHTFVCAESGKTTENRGIPPPPANAAETAPYSGRTFGRPLYGPPVLAGSMRCPSECPPSPKSEPRRQGAGRAFGDRFRRPRTRTRTVRRYCRSFRNGYAGRTGRLSDRRPERRTLARNSPVRLLL